MEGRPACILAEVLTPVALQHHWGLIVGIANQANLHSNQPNCPDKGSCVVAPGSFTTIATCRSNTPEMAPGTIRKIRKIRGIRDAHEQRFSHFKLQPRFMSIFQDRLRLLYKRVAIDAQTDEETDPCAS
jgi:hypothetical protein